MSNYTRLGGQLWNWEPWTQLEASPRILWLALYTSLEARRVCPGLWHGGIATMSEAARMPLQDTSIALDKLLEFELVEFDPKMRVLRLCELPDTGEWPTNGNCLRGWWNRFRDVPPCQVRDAHVRTLRWIVEQGAVDARKHLSHDHSMAWSETFGSITVPSVRRRGVRRIADSDTSTAIQPSLFVPVSTPAPIPVSIPDEPTPSTGYPQGLSATYPQDRVTCGQIGRTSEPRIRDLNDFNAPETLSKGFGKGSGEGEIQSPDFFSSFFPDRSPDLEASLGPPDRSRTAQEHVQRQVTQQATEQERAEQRPVLRLVPPYTVEQMMAAISESAKGKYDSLYDGKLSLALCDLHERSAGGRVGLDDYRVLGEHRAKCGSRFDARWLTTADIPKEIARARRELEQSAERLAMLNEFVPPRPG